jgi:hypothetical protein
VTTNPLPVLSYIQALLANKETYAVVSQKPSGALSMQGEVGPGSANQYIEPLVGPEGAAGTSQFPLLFEPVLLESTDDLPTDLTNTAADIGRYYLIVSTDGDGNVTASAAYIWYGAQFRILPFGPQGPPGPYGIIAPQVSLIGADETSLISVPDDDEGTASNPYRMTMELSVPDGPPGTACPLAHLTDVDVLSTLPFVGQFLAYDSVSELWTPQWVGDINPLPYTIPAAAFSSYVGISFAETVTVCTFAIPPQTFEWKPLVWGQVEMWELELSTSPLQIGIEVLLGSPNPEVGTLIARGFGNSVGGLVTISPHTSTPSSPSAELTPTNGVGLVPANHTGTQGTIYVNLINDGVAAIYDFNANKAQMFVLAVPASIQPPAPIPGAVSTKVVLSAKTISHGS